MYNPVPATTLTTLRRCSFGILISAQKIVIMAENNEVRVGLVTCLAFNLLVVCGNCGQLTFCLHLLLFTTKLCASQVFILF